MKTTSITLPGTMSRLMKPNKRCWVIGGSARPPTTGGGGSWAVIGATEAGRVLVVVLTRRGSTVRVITARDATTSEKRRYRR